MLDRLEAPRSWKTGSTSREASNSQAGTGKSTRFSPYWSSSSYALDFPGRAWMVDFFGNNIANNFGKPNTFFLRAVRTAP